MPELVPKSIAAPAAPPIPPGYPPIPPEIMRPAVPPIIQPSAWEDYPIFRETFLMYVSEPEFNASLRTMGEYFFGMLLECYSDWPEWPESSTKTEMRAALADIRHLQGFLASVGQERRVSSLSRSDGRLSHYASGAARLLNRVANTIEKLLAEEKGK